MAEALDDGEGVGEGGVAEDVGGVLEALEGWFGEGEGDLDAGVGFADEDQLVAGAVGGEGDQEGGGVDAGVGACWPNMPICCAARWLRPLRAWKTRCAITILKLHSLACAPPWPSVRRTKEPHETCTAQGRVAIRYGCCLRSIYQYPTPIAY